MRCPSLRDLPPPPPGRTGWPWTEGSASLSETTSEGERWPRVTVVTPSFNQAAFLEATIRSVLLQGYLDLEYFVLDGGSSDGSVEIIKRYEPWISWWVSEPDRGQSAAINRGLRRGTGVFATWINSDDLLYPNALTAHADAVGFQQNTVYVGDCLYIDEHDMPRHLHRGRVYSLEDLVNVRTIWRAPQRRGHIVQPEVLFPLELALRVGGVDEANHRTMDYDLWGKFFLAGTRFEYTCVPFAMFRVHGQQKTSQAWAMTKSLVETAARLTMQAPSMPEPRRQQVIADLHAYERDYWLGTGPLARLGLPEKIVLPLRESHMKWRQRAVAFVRRVS